VEERIVPGGVVALIRGIAALDEMQLEGDKVVGVSIVKRALGEPRREGRGCYGQRITEPLFWRTASTRTGEATEGINQRKLLNKQRVVADRITLARGCRSMGRGKGWFQGARKRAGS
jgi:hypothetical protein